MHMAWMSIYKKQFFLCFWWGCSRLGGGYAQEQTLTKSPERPLFLQLYSFPQAEVTQLPHCCHSHFLHLTLILRDFFSMADQNERFDTFFVLLILHFSKVGVLSLILGLKTLKILKQVKICLLEQESFMITTLCSKLEIQRMGQKSRLQALLAGGSNTHCFN